MAGYDLHVHSHWSDGKSSVLELAYLAREANLDGFALTDHDTVEGWQDIATAKNVTGVTVFPGLEISTEWDDHDVHILGYGFNDDHAGIRQMLTLLADSRRERVYRMIENLNKLGYPLDMDKVFARVGSGVPGRPHIGAEMIAQGYAKTMQEVFERYLGRGCPAYSPRAKLPPWDAVATVTQAGGQAVLAHPGLDEAHRVLPQLIDAGLRGLEAYHPHHDEDQEQHYLRVAEKYGLFVTAGSDFHGFRDNNHGSIGCRRLAPSSLPAIFCEVP